MQSSQYFRAPHVVLVDDDAGLASSMVFMLDAERIGLVHFSSGEKFLAAVKQNSNWVQGPGCVLLDVRMPGENGVQIFEKLRLVAPEFPLPVVFMTGHGDIPMVTRVLKDGAYDFIEKPIEGEALLNHLQDYFAESERRFLQIREKLEITKRISELTHREREVMLHLYKGLSNKEIAEALGNSIRTIELRRATIYDKMAVKNTVEMARLLQSIGWNNS